MAVNWTKAVGTAIVVVIVMVLIVAAMDAFDVIDLFGDEGFGDAMGENVQEKFTYTHKTGPLPYQRPAFSIPGPSPTFSPLVNPLEKSVAQGIDSPIPGLSVVQQYGPGLESADTQIASRCRAACDADPTCGSYAVFDTVHDPERGLYGKGCRTYTNSNLYGPSTYPTVFATAPTSRARLVADGFVPPQGVADLFIKQSF